jgi:hypothetical protein
MEEWTMKNATVLSALLVLAMGATASAAVSYSRTHAKSPIVKHHNLAHGHDGPVGHQGQDQKGLGEHDKQGQDQAKAPLDHGDHGHQGQDQAKIPLDHGHDKDLPAPQDQDKLGRQPQDQSKMGNQDQNKRARTIPPRPVPRPTRPLPRTRG